MAMMDLLKALDDTEKDLYRQIRSGKLSADENKYAARLADLCFKLKTMPMQAQKDLGAALEAMQSPGTPSIRAKQSDRMRGV